jgi:hypothetical protein
MDIASLLPNPTAEFNKSLHTKWLKFQSLIDELNERQLPEGTVTAINSWVSEINDFNESRRSYSKLLGKNL